MVMQTILLIAGVACLIAALVLVLWPRWVAAVPAYVGLWLMHWSYYIAVPTLTFIFWGIATFITVGLFYLSPSAPATSMWDSPPWQAACWASCWRPA